MSKGKGFQAIEIDLDSIRFWQEEEKTKETKPDVEAVHECRLCATEYSGKYCPHCGLLHEE